MLSGKALGLNSNTHVVSLSKGGAQTFSLFGGNANAGKLYLLLGTLSGTKPGIKLGTVTLALNPDAYFFFMLGNPNTLIANSLGILSPSGTSTAKLNLPLGLPVSLAGTVLYHAYLVLDPSRLSFDFSSNAVPLTLVK